MSGGERPWRLRIRWWGIVGSLVCAAIFVWAEYARDEFPDRAHLLFFLQTLAGNWSPPKPNEFPNGWFVGTAALAVALNLGGIGVLITNVLSLARLERRQLMNTSRLFYLRDAVIKDELLRIVEEKFPM
jgi:ABC-type cobalamin transport system permease subunit